MSTRHTSPLPRRFGVALGAGLVASAALAVPSVASAAPAPLSITMPATGASTCTVAVITSSGKVLAQRSVQGLPRRMVVKAPGTTKHTAHRGERLQVRCGSVTLRRRVPAHVYVRLAAVKIGRLPLLPGESAYPISNGFAAPLGEQLGAGSYDNAAIAREGLSHLGQYLYTPGSLDHGQCKQAVNDWVYVASGHTQRLGGDYYENYAANGGVRVSRDNVAVGDIIQLTNPRDHANYYWPMHTAVILGHTAGSNSFDVVDSNYVAPDTVGRHSWDPYASAARAGLEVTIWRMGTVMAAPTPTPTPAPTPTPTPAPAPTWSETTGGAAHTWTNYTNAGGTEGPTIAGYTTVQIACKVTGFKVADGNTWWYRIASSPWNGAYYVSADAFYNNGQTSGSLLGTPFVDPNVPNC
ncbi:hypothetical protein [Nocardioides pocheonensis]|jgi:hypothetical protein|uniref:CHAP domain-containing protein n=1 Tax=Nocardioides pocheonensis TaxID=661485 RepID=A0A3N0GVQ7_9ACTN|nr:hypothetical protein [Nocardioides pocheonensis]RNM16238.1 hypothetical protein EFL26_05620 [Nocardioides pocheonensis]